jgi:hypothetical protein
MDYCRPSVPGKPLCEFSMVQETQGVFVDFYWYTHTLHLVTYKWNNFVFHVSGAEKFMKKPMADFL